MAPYCLRAGAHLLFAWSIGELAELVDCAIDAGDRLWWLGTADARPLSSDDLTCLLTELAWLRSSPRDVVSGRGTSCEERC